jgi:hypothetical protein
MLQSLKIQVYEYTVHTKKVRMSFWTLWAGKNVSNILCLIAYNNGTILSATKTLRDFMGAVVDFMKSRWYIGDVSGIVCLG